MACDDAETAAETLAAAAAGPKRVRGDAGEVEQHSLRDLIEYEKFRRAKCATTKAHRGIRLTKLIPPGTT